MRIAAAALCVAIALGCPKGAPAHGDGMTATTNDIRARVRYTSTEVDEVHPLVLEVGSDGAAWLWVGSNADSPDDRTPGRYVGSVAPPDAAALRAAVASREFAAVKDPEGLEPGTPLRTLVLVPMQGEEVKRSAAGEAQPAFASAEEKARAIARRLVASPVQAIAVRLLSAGVSPKTPRVLDLALELANAGAQPISIAAFSADAPGTSLSVNALRDGVPPEQFKIHDQMFAQVSPDHVKSVEPAVQAGKPIALAPRAKRVLRLAVPMDPGPGAWRVRVQVETAIHDERGAEIGRCEVYSNSLVFRS